MTDCCGIREPHDHGVMPGAMTAEEDRAQLLALVDRMRALIARAESPHGTTCLVVLQADETECTCGLAALLRELVEAPK